MAGRPAGPGHVRAGAGLERGAPLGQLRQAGRTRRGLAEAAGAAGSGFVAADEYGLAAELARGLPDRTVLGVQPRWGLFALPHGAGAATAGLLVRSERRHDAPDGRYWSTLVPAGKPVHGRNGQVAGPNLE